MAQRIKPASQKTETPMKMWGVPDWRDDDAYGVAFGDTLRWEFLRRNPGYRQDWHRNNFGDAPAAFFPDAERKYGLEVIWNPSRSDAPAFVRPDIVMPPYTRSLDMHPMVVAFVQRAAEEGLFLTTLDPSLTLDSNIVGISEAYRKYAREFGGGQKATRQKIGTYPRHLQMIDARQAGATYNKIKDHLDRRGDETSVEALRKLYARAKKIAERITGVEWVHA